MKCFDNNDTVSYGFKRFQKVSLKNETIKREVKLSFGTKTMLISLSNWIYRTGKLKVSRPQQIQYI